MAEKRIPEDLKEGGDPGEGRPYAGEAPDPVAEDPTAPEDLKTGGDRKKGSRFTGTAPDPVPDPDDAPN